jgi:hypothetical protein
MFSAVDRAKAGHWFNHNPAWRDALRIEDTLTALVFDVLQTLSGKTVAALLGMIVRVRDAQGHAYDPSWLAEDDFSVNYWPRTKDNIEPDVLIISEGGEHILIVESKWRQAHGARQLRDEIDAVAADYHGYVVDILAFGDEHHDATLEFAAPNVRPSSSGRVLGATWRELARAVSVMAESQLVPAERRALGLLESGLRFFGYRRFDGLHHGLETLALDVGSLDALASLPGSSTMVVVGPAFGELGEVSFVSLDIETVAWWRI